MAEGLARSLDTSPPANAPRRTMLEAPSAPCGTWVSADEVDELEDEDGALVHGSARAASDEDDEVDELELAEEDLDHLPDAFEPWRPRERQPARRREALLTREELAAIERILPRAFPGGMTLEQIGEILGVTRERVRQIEARALEKLAGHPAAREAIAELLSRGPDRPTF